MKPTIRSSKSDRVLSCPGSLTLEPRVAERDDGDGWEGTYLHWLIASRAISELGATTGDGLPLPPPNVPAGYVCPANSLWIADWAIRHMHEVIPDDWAIVVEVEMSNEFDRWIDVGHADWLAFSPCGTKAKGADWKTGRDPVDPAESNEQVASYLTLVKCEWPQVQEAVFQICQPRVSEDDGFERVSTVRVTDLDHLVRSFDARMCEALDKPMELETGKKQCRWCPVSGPNCPAHKALKSKMKLTLTPDAIEQVKLKPDDATLGQWVADMRILKPATERAEELLHARIDELGTVIATDGTQITRKVSGGSYEITHPKEYLAAFRKLAPSEESLVRCYTPSVTATRDEIAVVMNVNKTGKAAVTAKTIFDSHLRPYVTQGVKRVLQFL